MESLPLHVETDHVSATPKESVSRMEWFLEIIAVEGGCQVRSVSFLLGPDTFPDALDNVPQSLQTVLTVEWLDALPQSCYVLVVVGEFQVSHEGNMLGTCARNNSRTHRPCWQYGGR